MPSASRPRARLPSAALLAGLLLAGCGSKVDERSFAQIEAGMTEAQVQAILGEPTETSAVGLGPVSGSSSEWRDEHATISVQFVNGKVTFKNFSRR